MLSINYTITAIATGKLSPDSDKEYLAIGTENNILVYQVRDEHLKIKNFLNKSLLGWR